MIMVYGTSSGPQNYTGDYLGPCSKLSTSGSLSYRGVVHDWREWIDAHSVSGFDVPAGFLIQPEPRILCAHIPRSCSKVCNL